GSGSGLRRLLSASLVHGPRGGVPLHLEDASRTAIAAARAHSHERLIVAPRLEDRYPTYGVTASVVRLGRTGDGTPAAVIRAEERVRIGSGVSGPGTALWVEAAEVDEGASDTDHVTELADEYRSLAIAMLQRRDA